MVLLDSVGLKNPILSNDKKEFQENMKDKVITELFLENLIVAVSDILLVVVGELTYSEQLLINKIKEESKNHNKSKIFIIHNLQEYVTKEQVEKYIDNTLLKCSSFNLIKQIMEFTPKFPKNKIDKKDKNDKKEKKKKKEKKEKK